jgi:hypothetical protein
MSEIWQHMLPDSGFLVSLATNCVEYIGEAVAVAQIQTKSREVRDHPALPVCFGNPAATIR